MVPVILSLKIAYSGTPKEFGEWFSLRSQPGRHSHAEFAVDIRA